MRARIAACAATCAVAAGVIAANAGAASGPPPPRTHGGAKATLFVTGLKNPTSFAWGDGAMFAGDSGSSEKAPNGGVYVIRNGKASELPHSPAFVGGMAWHAGALYLSDAAFVGGAPQFQISRWSGWNGKAFTRRKVLYVGPRGFEGFDGLAFGPDGRLYVGVAAGLLNNNDHGPATISPDVYDILTMSATGSDVQVFASGIRQPWQMAFARGSADPFVSDLGQDGPKSVLKLNPPDFVLHVHQGDDYGFPTCNRTQGSDCAGKATPFREFAPHSSIMGMAVIGQTLYMGSFLGMGGKGGGALYRMSIHGGAVTPVVTGFPAATDALGTHRGDLYVGGSGRSGGVVYKVTP